MDTFTQNILARARERQKLLHEYQDNKENQNVNREIEQEIQSAKKVLSEERLYKSEENNDQENRTSFNKPNSKTVVESKTLGPPGSPRHNTLNITKENFNMEIKVTSSDQIRFQVEIEEDDEDNNVELSNEEGLRKATKDRLNRLGKLYAGGEDANISSPIHRTEENFLLEDETDVKSRKTEKVKKGKGLKSLQHLAETINQWEDVSKPPIKAVDVTPKVKPKKNQAPQPPKLPQNTDKKNMESESSNTKKDVNKFSWDKSVLQSLESQGFTKTKSDSRLVYEYPCSKLKEENNAQKVPFNKVESNIVTSNDRSPKKIVKSSVSDKAALFESPIQNKTAKDPSSLSISERKALFEKNKGEVLLPKAPFGMAIPIDHESKKTTKQIASKFAQSPFIKSDESAKAPKKDCLKEAPKKYPAPAPPSVVKKPESPVKSGMKVSPVKAATHQAAGIANTMAALLEKKNTICQEQIETRIKAEREKEMGVLLNRFNKRKENIKKNSIEEESESEQEDYSETDRMITVKEPSIIVTSPTINDSNLRPGTKRHSMSPKVAAVLEDVKRIKVSPAKPGRLYPNLSDIEAATETENEDVAGSTPSNSNDNSYESGDADTSFGREILEAVCKNQTPHKRVSYPESDLSDVLDDMDDYLDEAIAYTQAMKENGPTPSKQTKPSVEVDNALQTSESFQYKAFSKSTLEQQDFKSPLKIRSPRKSIENQNYVVEGENVLPLTHTVSFYRKQQAKAPSSPTKHIKHVDRVDEESSDDNTDQIVLDKIRKLQEEVNKQQMIISQTSQALNICNTTLEFMGSTEQVEAEKVLLLSTHRRQAIMNEIQRLNIEGTLTPQNKHAQDVPLEKGSLTISNIVLPLKNEYVRALAAAGGKGHHVVCLVKCGEQVVSSKLVSTVATNVKNLDYELRIPDSIILKDIYSDFAITFEVYCLQAQEELLPHDVKYHINKKSSKSTPKKSKDSRLIRPIKESPAGPQAVRSPSFALMGYVVFSIKQMNKTHWNLNNTPSMSPLEGSVHMKLACELTVSVEQRGFLTMFEDVSGFGAWHRRWCLLKGHTLSYWKYPDDEKKSPPIDSLDLRHCITKEVGPVSREICARLYTFLIELEREPRSTDKDTLVTICKKDKTIVRHLLSADTKEERIQWCAKFNAALMAFKLWGNTNK